MMPTGTVADTKERLMRAGERLFARDGIHGTRVRDLNELAGQRNPSALHYHFGSRAGLLEAIMLRYQLAVDAVVEERLDELIAAGGRLRTADVIDAVVRPMVATLRTESGRDCARIIPQMLSTLSDNLRRGVAQPATPQSVRILQLLHDLVPHLDERGRRERLVAYALTLSTLLAERAHQVESGHRPTLSDDEFRAHLVTVLDAVLHAPAAARR